jgi:hypothetical protein
VLKSRKEHPVFTTKTPEGFLDYFKDIKDPRINRKKLL